MRKNNIPYIILAILLILTVIQLRFQERLWICSSGNILFWVSDTWSSDNSQHFLDPYSFSHFQHGLVFFGLLYFFRKKTSITWLFVIAIGIEASWEILENSKMVIDRYREATAALGYSGDTILNSFGDLVSCGLGFIVASFLKSWQSWLLFFLIEIIMILTIKDSLVLNVIMLLYPLEGIKEWQLSSIKPIILNSFNFT